MGIVRYAFVAWGPVDLYMEVWAAKEKGVSVFMIDDGCGLDRVI